MSTDSLPSRASVLQVRSESPDIPTAFNVPPTKSNVIVAIPARPLSDLVAELQETSPPTTDDASPILDGSSDETPVTERKNTPTSTGTRKRRTRIAPPEIELQIPDSEINCAASLYPKSLSRNFVPPFPIHSEADAVHDLLSELKKIQIEDPEQCEEDFVEFTLSDFSIYLPRDSRHPNELRGLQSLETKLGHTKFLFDGILTVGTVQRYVTRIPFQICSIGNYGEDLHMVGSDIWLQSESNTKQNIYYRLQQPSDQYKLFYDGFIWLANLAKHFVDFSQSVAENTVSIHRFRSEFAQWIKKHHWESPAFQDWYNQFGVDDFRTQIVTNIRFLFKEAVGVNEDLRSEPIFKEVMDMNSVPEQPMVETKTIVTPFVYECFEHLRFGEHLKAMEVETISREQQINRGAALNLTKEIHVALPQIQKRVENLIPKSNDPPNVIETRSPSSKLTEHQRMIQNIRCGDVLCVVKDGLDSNWKDEESKWKQAGDHWYMLVQEIHKVDGAREFSGIWLYESHDTSCAKMRYPFTNELFCSNHCNCEDTHIEEDEILSIVKVRWHGSPIKGDDRLFIRQTYLDNERFVTLRKEHKRCSHMETKSPTRSTSQFSVGQTVLAKAPRSKYLLEPYEIVEINESDDTVLLRCLKRRKDVDDKGKPNELVYTDDCVRMSTKKIERTCLVRFYNESDITESKIPAPYSRDGTGNAFYISTRQIEVQGVRTLQPITHNLPRTLLQGFDPLDRSTRLRGLDLYCGGGNFGRGIEEGGAVHNDWAVDIAKPAIHTYAANLEDPKGTKLFYGSVNDMLSQAIQGNPQKSDLIPAPGEVDFISAGSPCQGFSMMNQDRGNLSALMNQSLVASVAAYIDFYRPKYGLLENVMSMAQKGLGRDQDVLSQLICTIVGLGYQCQIFVVDAWSCGVPQSRSRLFVSFAAPGLQPLDHPALSHAHPPWVTTRSVGLMANGQAFAQRQMLPTAFKQISAGSGTADLPDIGDGHTYHCIKKPEHILAHHYTRRVRLQIKAIPGEPHAYGSNFGKVFEKYISPEMAAIFGIKGNDKVLKERFRKESKSWGRIESKKLISVVLSNMHVSDARNGAGIHWTADRTLTILELKRAQGFLDEEPIVGSGSDVNKILGNSVARGVALSLGLALREAWMKNPPSTEAGMLPVHATHVEQEQEQGPPSPGRRVVDTTRRSKNTVSMSSARPRTWSESTSGYGSDEDSSQTPISFPASASSFNHKRSQNGENRALPAELKATKNIISRLASEMAIRERAQQPSGNSGQFSANNQPPKRRLDMLEPETPESTKFRNVAGQRIPTQEDSQSNTSNNINSLSVNGQSKKTVDPSVLADRLADLQNSSTNRGAYFYNDPESESDEDVRFIPAATYKVSKEKASQNHRQMPSSRQIVNPMKKARVVINLISDDEDDEEAVSKQLQEEMWKRPTPNFAAPKATHHIQAKPVSNDSFRNIYQKAQSNGNSSSSNLQEKPIEKVAPSKVQDYQYDKNNIYQRARTNGNGTSPGRSNPSQKVVQNGQFDKNDMYQSVETNGYRADGETIVVDAPFEKSLFVDESSLNVYEQTSRYMKYDTHRRHGPKSGWGGKTERM